VRPEVDWASLDWERSDREIAAETGRDRKTVARRRRRVDAGDVSDSPEARGRRASYDAVPWDAADWRRPDEEIARALGCHVRSVRRRRGQLHPAPAPDGAVKRKLPWSAVDWSMSDHYIAGWSGRHVAVVARMRASPYRAASGPRRTADDYGW
jgi:hypothetical protein